MVEPGTPKKPSPAKAAAKKSPSATTGKSARGTGDDRVTPVTRLGDPGQEIDDTEGREAFLEFLAAAKELILDHSSRSHQAAQLRTYEALEVRRIQAAEARLRDYFDQVFAERREIYQGFFERLDRALDEQNTEAVAAVVSGIVDLAKSSPIIQAGDEASIRMIWNDPSTPFTI